MYSKAFTLIELLLVISLFALTSAIVVPFTINQVTRSQIDAQVDKLRSSIFLVQQNAYTGKNSGSFGIYFGSDTYTVYEGLLNSDIEQLPSNIEITNVSLNDLSNEIIFSDNSIIPSTYGDITLSDGVNTIVLTITEQGSILVN